MIARTVEQEKKQVVEEVSRLHPGILRFLLVDCLHERTTWPMRKTGYLFSDWRQQPLTDERVWEEARKLFSMLTTRTLMLSATNYVSTRGGETRDP